MQLLTSHFSRDRTSAVVALVFKTYNHLSLVKQQSNTIILTMKSIALKMTWLIISLLGSFQTDKDNGGTLNWSGSSTNFKSRCKTIFTTKFRNMLNYSSETPFSICKCLGRFLCISHRVP